MLYRTGLDPIADALAGAIAFIARQAQYPALEFQAWRLESVSDWERVIDYLRTRHAKAELAELLNLLLQRAEAKEVV